MSLLTSWDFGGYVEAVYEPKALLTYRHQSAHQGKFLLLAFGSFEDPIHSLLLALKDEPCTCASAIVIYLYHYQPLCVFKIWFQFLNKSLHPIFLVFKSLCGIEQDRSFLITFLETHFICCISMFPCKQHNWFDCCDIYLPIKILPTADGWLDPAT
jgi:hypothetical protein